jgi:hypothetical protein
VQASTLTQFLDGFGFPVLFQSEGLSRNCYPETACTEIAGGRTSSSKTVLVSEPVPGRPSINEVRLSAICTGSHNHGFTMACYAFADPIFSFDQQVFDRQNAEADLSTFLLSDYYRLTLSPNVGPPVAGIPEPSTILLAGFGAASLFTLLRVLRQN